MCDETRVRELEDEIRVLREQLEDIEQYGTGEIISAIELRQALSKALLRNDRLQLSMDVLAFTSAAAMIVVIAMAVLQALR